MPTNSSTHRHGKMKLMFNGRLLHLIKTSWLLWRLRKSKTDETREAAHQALAAQLASGRGLPMKIGQVLAGMEDSNAYNPLTTSVKPWKLKDMIPVLENAWGHPNTTHLQSIDESVAAASLGQVHHAVLKSGEEAAVKIQYPDIAKAIESEMTLTGLLPKGGPVKRWDFDLDAYKATLKTNMLFELDYMHEARQQETFRRTIHVKGLHIPKVYPELCRASILVQSWSSGSRLAEAANWSNIQRLQLSKILMQTMFQSLFDIGLVHGDPHPGNILFHQNNDESSITLLDYGCMIEVAPERRIALLQLILASRGECHISPLHGFATLGFDATKLKYIEDKLPQLMQILFRPFTETKPFNPSEWHPGTETEQLLGDYKWIFRAAGPADLFLLMRVFQGLVQHLITLKTKLPWWPILEQSIASETIRSAKASSKLNHPNISEEESANYQGAAKELHIRISEGNRQTAKITLPATAAFEISTLMPPTAANVLSKEKINLTAIEQRLMNEGLNPQSLIDIHSGSKRYELWLE